MKRVLIVLAAAVVIWASQRWIRGDDRYPYGYHQCCTTAMHLALMLYSADNHGVFPAGAKTPEASLSLLLQKGHCGTNNLKGKTVRLEAAEAALKQDGVLGPESCGWIYVEGLNESDSGDLAILWDRVPGWNHNGSKTSDGGREVLFLGGHNEWIRGADWTNFLSRQEKMRAARPAPAKRGIPALVAKVRLPSGELVDRYDGSFELRYEGTTLTGGALDSSSLGRLKTDCLDCTVSFTLTLPGMRSKPVTVTVTNGVASPDQIIFEMEPTK